ncbi:MAG: rod shape-determining protein MreD [Paracoccaceae bacterium]
MGSQASRIWIMRLVYCALMVLILFFHLLPLDTVPRHWAPPDLFVAFTFAWVTRRPDYVPVLLVAAVMLTVDLLLQKPPGLLAAMVVAGCAFLRGRAATPASETGFVTEWLTVSGVLFAIFAADRAILGLTEIGSPPFLLSASQLVLTILFYPIAVAISQIVFGVRKLKRSDADAVGARS